MTTLTDDLRCPVCRQPMYWRTGREGQRIYTCTAHRPAFEVVVWSEDVRRALAEARAELRRLALAQRDGEAQPGQGAQQANEEG